MNENVCVKVTFTSHLVEYYHGDDFELDTDADLFRIKRKTSRFPRPIMIPARNVLCIGLWDEEKEEYL